MSLKIENESALTSDGKMVGKAASQAMTAMNPGKQAAKLLSKTRVLRGAHPVVGALTAGLAAVVVNGTAQALAEKGSETIFNTFRNQQQEERPRLSIPQHSQNPSKRIVYREINRAQTFSSIPTPKMFDTMRRANTYPGAFPGIAENRLQESQPSIGKMIAEATHLRFTEERSSITTSPTIEAVTANRTNIKIRSNVKLPLPANDGTYTMAQVRSCIDTDINFNVEKTGNTYQLSLPESQKGRAFYKGNPGKFPIKIKLTASEEHYREALDKETIQIKARSGEVKEVVEPSQPKAATKISRA